MRFFMLFDVVLCYPFYSVLLQSLSRSLIYILSTSSVFFSSYLYSYFLSRFILSSTLIAFCLAGSFHIHSYPSFHHVCTFYLHSYPAFHCDEGTRVVCREHQQPTWLGHQWCSGPSEAASATTFCMRVRGWWVSGVVLINPFTTRTHFHHEFGIWLGGFIDVM